MFAQCKCCNDILKQSKPSPTIKNQKPTRRDIVRKLKSSTNLIRRVLSRRRILQEIPKT